METDRKKAMVPGTNGEIPLRPLHPKRVLFFGKRKSRSCCTGALVDALRSRGLQVLWINCSLFRRWLGSYGMHGAVRLCRRLYRPDLCFVFFHDLPPILMAEFSKRIPTVVWMEEQTQFLESSHIEYVRDARLLCLSTPSLVRAYRAHGIEHATFQMSGFSPKYHRPFETGERDGVWERDLAFIGGPGHMGNRPEFLAGISEVMNLEIFGRKESWLPYLERYPTLRLSGEVRPRGYARVCATSKILLGLNQTHDSHLYFSNRFFLTLACKGFHLVRYVPGIEKVFRNGEHLVWFRSREECLELAGHYLERDEERRRIAEAGHALVREKHSYGNRVAEILDILALRRGLSCPEEDGSPPLRPTLLLPKKGAAQSREEEEGLRKVEWA